MVTETEMDTWDERDLFSGITGGHGLIGDIPEG